MESALYQPNGAKLIETLGWDGVRMPRLSLHLARLSAGARALGYPCDTGAAEAALRAACPPAPARLRLQLMARGDISVEVSPLPPQKPLWRVGLADARLFSDDPWLRIKSTRRAAYDAARASMPMGLDEVLLLNERGEVCDGTITTLFYDLGEGLRTPPLTSGLLPGVLRAEIACPERVLMAAELPLARIWLGNSLRGLIPAVWDAGPY